MTHLRLLLDGVGMLSFVCSAAAYLMTSMIRLRMLAICSGMLGLIYNSTLASGPLWLVLFWLGLFLCINTGMLVRAIYRDMEVALTPDSRALLVATFPTMHSRDWLALRRVATSVEHPEGSELLAIGDSTHAVHIVAQGTVDEIRTDGTVLHRTPSAMWGELSFVTTQQFDGSPCRIVTTTPTVELVFPYSALDALCAKNLRLRAALMEGFVRTGCLKHGLLCDRGGTVHGAEKDVAIAEHNRVVKREHTHRAEAVT